jgi:Cdc6-like AAA superfamily ATPase
VTVFDDVPEHEWSSTEEACQLVQSLLSKKYAPLSGHFLHVHDDIDKLLRDADKIKRERLYQLRMDSLENLID